jgi:putative endonuclease
MCAKEALARAAAKEAVSYLKGCGFRTLDQDWRYDGEIIPVIAAERGALVVIDLRVRAGTRHGAPLDAIGTGRRRMMRGLATRWLAGHGMRYDQIRIDVVGLLQTGTGGFTIEHVRAVG